MSSPKPNCDLCQKLGLRPLNKENVFFFYVPLHSLVSYAALSVNVMNPALVARLGIKKDITNFLLVHTLFGSTLYIYSRPHMKSLPPGKRATYSILGSALFGLGSVLAWAIAKSAFPKNNTSGATVFGIASGILVVKCARDYFKDCDELAKST